MRTFEKEYKRKPLIGCFGLTFKPNIEDIRESASIKIVKDLIINKYDVICCDPNLNSLDNITLKSFDYLIKNCDLLVLLVAHNEFKNYILQIRNYDFFHTPTMTISLITPSVLNNWRLLFVSIGPILTVQRWSVGWFKSHQRVPVL